MGDHQAGVGGQSGDGIIVERLPTDVVIGDTGEPADLFRNGHSGILEPGIAVADAVEDALGREVEGQDGKLDDLVARGIEAGRLDVDDQAETLGGGIVIGVALDDRHAPEDAVIAALLQTQGQVFEIVVIGHGSPPVARHPT